MEKGFSLQDVEGNKKIIFGTYCIKSCSSNVKNAEKCEEVVKNKLSSIYRNWMIILNWLIR
jgi:hypothetical protein